MHSGSSCPGCSSGGGGALSHTRNQLEAAVHAKGCIEAGELISEVYERHILCYILYVRILYSAFFDRAKY